MRTSKSSFKSFYKILYTKAIEKLYELHEQIRTIKISISFILNIHTHNSLDGKVVYRI